jgi:predicted ribosome quality control (RQC) complex YloA/Tae2 family protein
MFPTLFFSPQGSPGSHVLLQLEPGDQPSPEGIQYAADVASFYSKARGSTQVINGTFENYRDLYLKKVFTPPNSYLFLLLFNISGACGVLFT